MCQSSASSIGLCTHTASKVMTDLMNNVLEIDMLT